MTREQRYRATVEYDGADFLGYQIQATGRTVQGEIERSLKQVTQTSIRIDGAGRTDAGVHATGQVIAFNATWRHSLTDLHRALNATLANDVVVSDLTIVNPDFHPRFQAVSRTYHYTILNRRWPAALQRRYAHHIKEPLNMAAMREASQQLVGSHDFASFGKPPQGEVTIRNVLAAQWVIRENDLVVFEITANAFLYRMVRTIVGTLILIGLGHLQADDIARILAAKDLQQSAPPAPPQGLCLVRVTYPEIL